MYCQFVSEQEDENDKENKKENNIYHDKFNARWDNYQPDVYPHIAYSDLLEDVTVCVDFLYRSH